MLASQEKRQEVDWKHCWLFWSDERAVAPTDTDSNYHMAMEAGLKTLGIPPEQIFRMVAENNIAQHAIDYEAAIKKHVNDAQFDLVMLGMGDDGHTASLFPWTEGLHVNDRLVIANYIPEKKVWRMSLTFECINKARDIDIYILGDGKADMVKKALTGPYKPDDLPIQKVGTKERPAFWICDSGAAAGVGS
jgi:6-phosphogluconolactonase